MLLSKRSSSLDLSEESALNLRSIVLSHINHTLAVASQTRTPISPAEQTMKFFGILFSYRRTALQRCNLHAQENTPGYWSKKDTMKKEKSTAELEATKKHLLHSWSTWSTQDKNGRPPVPVLVCCPGVEDVEGLKQVMQSTAYHWHEDFGFLSSTNKSNATRTISQSLLHAVYAFNQWDLSMWKDPVVQDLLDELAQKLVGFSQFFELPDPEAPVISINTDIEGDMDLADALPIGLASTQSERIIAAGRFLRNFSNHLLRGPFTAITVWEHDGEIMREKRKLTPGDTGGEGIWELIVKACTFSYHDY